MSRARWIIVGCAVVFLATATVVFLSIHASNKATTPPDVIGVDSKVVDTGSAPKPTAEEWVKVQELFPGDTCDKASALLGVPDEKDQFVRTWRKKDFTVFASTNPNCVLSGVGVTVVPRHTAITRDGITLGASTIADAERILRSRLTDSSESVEAPEDNWDAMLVLDPTSTFPYKTVYRAKLDSKKVTQMNRDPKFDDFRGQVITEYSLELAAPVQPTQ